LGIFARNNISLKQLNWSNVYEDHTVKHFLPCLINDDFQILGIWAHKNNSPNFGYIGQVWKYFQTNKNKLDKILIAGDFNSNAIWDAWDRWWNHSDVTKELNELDINSLYHHFYKEQQGKESIPTFYLQRNPKKPYHLDYVFGSKEFVERMTKVEIADMERWLLKSDHMPVICEFEL
jgi:endonuclease/exonuclease/phosphatase family metal-dependent hydrolase